MPARLPAATIVAAVLLLALASKMQGTWRPAC